MTLSGFFNFLGGIFQWTFQWLQNDFWLTYVANYGIIALGFVGLFFWLKKQMEFNKVAEHDYDQLK